MRKYLLSLGLAIVAGSVLASDLSAPVFIEYESSMSAKKKAITNVIENASTTHAKNIYIYYHDSKSQELAGKIQSRMADKVPTGCKTVLVDQSSGTPKYPATATPNGVAMIVGN